MASRSVSGAKAVKPPPPQAQRTPVSTIPATAAAKGITTSAKSGGKVSHVPTSKSTPHTELHLTSPVDVPRTSPPFPGELGSIVEYRSVSWKVAYRGPVFFSEEEYLGLVATTAVLTSSDQQFPGNCNGTVEGTTYFICEDGRGLMVPAREVLGVPSLPSERDDGDDLELSSSISGLVVGPQSIRKLKAEVSDERAQHRSALQHNATCPQHHQRVLVASVGVQVDGPPVDEGLPVHRPISCSQLVAGHPPAVHELSEASAALSYAIARWHRTMDPLIAEEDQWISAVSQSAAALHPTFAWSDVINRCSELKARLDAATATGSPSDVGGDGGTREEILLGPMDGKVQHSRLSTALLKFSIPRSDHVSVSEEDLPVVPILRQSVTECSQSRTDALRQALTPLIDYAGLPEVAVDPSKLESANTTALRRLGTEPAGSNIAVVLANDCDAQEAERRLLFEIESICQDAAAAASEGRVEQLETLGHLRVDAAQKLQQSSAGVLELFGPLQKQFVEVPRAALRDAIKECDAAFAQQLDLVANEDILASSARIAELQTLLEELQDGFIRDMFHNNTEVVSARQEVLALHEKEKSALEELSTAFERWDAVRRSKVSAMRQLQRLSDERRHAFEAHHDAMSTLVLQKLEHQCACDWAKSVQDRILEIRKVVIPDVLEREVATLMHLQRMLFERQTAAHDRHQQSFRQVCLAAEELAFRKEQAHQLICDRLDRCNMEVELAQDSLDSRCSGLVREARELDRVAREMFDDITAIRCVVTASHLVFQEKSAPLLIQCGKLAEDPVAEAKRLCDEKRQKLLTITQRLQSQ